MKKTALALTACAALTLAACGDKTLSKAEFTKQANAICASMEKRVEAAGQKVAKTDPGASMDEMMTKVVDAVAPIVEDTVTKLRALEAPEELQDDVDEMLDSVESETDAIKKDPKLLAGDAAYKDSNEKASDLGLDECAS